MPRLHFNIITVKGLSAQVVNMSLLCKCWCNISVAAHETRAVVRYSHKWGKLHRVIFDFFLFWILLYYIIS